MRSAAVAALLATFACAPHLGRRGAPAPPSATTFADRATAGTHVHVRVRLLARRRLPYVASTFGPGATSVGFEITNASSRRVAVPSLRVSFTAIRDRVSFACDVARRVPDGEREADALDPGESYTYRRALDCRMPVAGTYRITAKLALGDGALAEVGGFTVAVEPHGRVPLEHPEVRGVFAMISGDTAARPQGAIPGYAVVLLVVNASEHTVHLEHSHVVFRVARETSRIPCMGEAVPLEVRTLAPGAVHVRKVPVTCVWRDPGRYSIEGSLVVGGKAEAPLGTVPLVVSTDPLLFTAPPAY